MTIQDFLSRDPSSLSPQAQKIRARFQMLVHTADQAQRDAEMAKLKAVRALGAVEEFEKFVLEFVSESEVDSTPKEN